MDTKPILIGATALLLVASVALVGMNVETAAPAETAESDNPELESTVRPIGELENSVEPIDERARMQGFDVENVSLEHREAD